MVWLSDMLTGRKQAQFLDIMGQHAALLVQAAGALERYFQSPSSQTEEAIAAIRIRSEQIVSQTVAALTDTFVTPFDRQDIYNLAQGIDEMIYYLASAATEAQLFKADATPQMQKMAEMLTAAANDIKTAVNDIATSPDSAVKCAKKARDVENKIEDLYRHTLAELFDTSDVHRILKQREIYRHLSNSADRAVAIGQLIGKIVVKVA
ncbi:MAG TPA: DUF47 family protein [Candidatus Binatus sp.]|nr:DUF47 family protein [Candidatus Binatus sp.]